jgi:glycosyltransferase involved in cell wall biosynthesis
MRLLQVAGTLDPAYGGPPVVLNQITSSLSALGHIIDVATLDSSAAPWMRDAPGHPYAFGPATGKYGYSRRLRTWLRHHAADYDAVLVHGIWQYQSRVTRQACRSANVPYFVFVHGALDPWFEMHYPAKHAKKSLYWRLFEHRVLRDAKSVLFTKEEERQLARTSFSPYRVVETVVDIGIQEPEGDAGLQRKAFLSAFPDLQNKRLLLFLSRIHPKKGCDLLIRAFAAVCQHEPDLRLVVAGPDEAGTRASLEALIETLEIGDRITWTGMLSGDAKWGAYHAADVFALTSHSENFGIVVPEALACGLPVLITDKVNIWREIERAGAGLVEPDTEEGATALLRHWLALTESERADMRVCARKCFADNFDPHNAASKFVDVLSQVIGAGNP